MNRKYLVIIKQRIALLLVAAFIILQTATAFAVENINAEETSAVSGESAVSGDTVLLSDAVVSSDETVSLDAIVPEDGAVSGDIAVSGDAAVSGNEAVSEDSAVSGDSAVSEDIIPDLFASLNKLLSEKTVRGVIFNCEKCAVKEGPSEKSRTIAVIPCASTIVLKSVSFNEEELWFEVRACLGETEVTGYVKKKNTVFVDEDYIKWEKEFSGDYGSDGDGVIGGVMSTGLRDEFMSTCDAALSSIENFPESYRDKLYALNASHPNWIFVPQNMGNLTLASVVDGEYADKNRNWISSSAKDSFKDGAAPQTGWYYASKSCISYYMNPTNFFDDSHIFQFEQLAYNSSYHTQDGVQSILNGTFMAGKIPDDTMTYAEAFMKIGSALGLSPYHLSSRVRLEQGVNGTSPLISGTYPGYEGYYNYFNINASGDNMVVKGLTYAKEQGWNTRYKSLNGGAAFLGNNYISAGQDTLYLEKFDLVGTLYTHQYMQNVQAPSSEAVTTYNQYKNAGTVNNPFIFKIPVFTDITPGGGSGKDKVNNVTPKATLKLIKKANLFYSQDCTESFAKYRINANVDIYGVRTAANAADKAGGNPYFEVYSLSGNILTLKTRNRTGENSKKTSKKVYLTISSDAGEFDASFNLSTVNSKPSIKASAAYIYTGFETGTVQLSDSKGEDIKLPKDTAVSTQDGTINCSVSADGGFITVKPDLSFKAGSRTFKLTSSSWTVPISIKAQVKRGGKPALKLSKKSAVLNTCVPMEKYGTLNLKAGVNGSRISLNGLLITAANTKTENALGSGLFAEYDRDNGVLRLGVKEGKAEKGNYSLILSGSVKNPAGEELELKSVKLKVSVIEKSPEKAYVLRKTGRINLVDRADSCVIYTPAFSGTGACCINRITVDNAKDFEVSLLRKGDITPDARVVAVNSGVIVIKAKDGAALNRAAAYNMDITSVLDNGLEIKKSVTIKPVQSAAKLYGNIVTAAMTRSTSTSRNYIIRSKGLTKDDTVIEKVEPDFGTLADSFSYKADEGQGDKRYFSGLFELTNKEIKNGTYSLRFKVYLKGRGENTGPAKVTLKVKIK